MFYSYTQLNVCTYFFIKYVLHLHVHLETYPCFVKTWPHDFRYHKMVVNGFIDVGEKKLNSVNVKLEEREVCGKSDIARKKRRKIGDRRGNWVIRRSGSAAIRKSVQRRAAPSFCLNNRNWKWTRCDGMSWFRRNQLSTEAARNIGDRIVQL